MNVPTKKLLVTAISQSDSGTVTAFLNDIPAILVQGNSYDDITNKLSLLLNSYLKRLDSMKNSFDIQVKPLVNHG